MAVELKYQNPASTDAVLDSEQVSLDGSGNPVVREFVVPQESVSNFDPLSKLNETLEFCLAELKKIRVLLETDVPPGLTEDEEDASEANAVGAEEATGGGAEEF